MDEGFGAPLLFTSAIVLLAVFMAVGLYLGGQAATLNAMAKASRNWVAAPGTIVSSGYDTRLHKGRPLASLFVTYRFEANGGSYTGSTLAFEKLDSMTVAVAEAKLKPYPPGAACQVYHDPNSPTKNVLEQGTRGSNLAQLSMAAFFVLAGLVCAYDCLAGGLNAMNRDR
jgi:hypothetical protein